MKREGEESLLLPEFFILRAATTLVGVLEDKSGFPVGGGSREFGLGLGESRSLVKSPVETSISSWQLGEHYVWTLCFFIALSLAPGLAHSRYSENICSLQPKLPFLGQLGRSWGLPTNSCCLLILSLPLGSSSGDTW